jgi:uncharacterized Ntn-hydrolase superfamily protein
MSQNSNKGSDVLQMFNFEAQSSALGNLLAGPEVVEAIAEEFHENESGSLEARLVCAIEAGRDAGGQEEGQTSAAILTHGDQSASRCDLRVEVIPLN